MAHRYLTSKIPNFKFHAAAGFVRLEGPQHDDVMGVGLDEHLDTYISVYALVIDPHTTDHKAESIRASLSAIVQGN